MKKQSTVINFKRVIPVSILIGIALGTFVLMYFYLGADPEPVAKSEPYVYVKYKDRPAQAKSNYDIHMAKPIPVSGEGVWDYKKNPNVTQTGFRKP